MTEKALSDKTEVSNFGKRVGKSLEKVINNIIANKKIQNKRHT